MSAADDPAIWVHQADPAKSRILGTNKKQGMLVYDLQGRQTQLLAAGRHEVQSYGGDIVDGTVTDLVRDGRTSLLVVPPSPPTRSARRYQ